MDKPVSLREITVRQDAYLPHWTAEGCIYHVVFRLADSLPAPVLLRLREKREARLKAAQPRSASETPNAAERSREAAALIESTLDQGFGACWFRREDLAAGMAGALARFSGVRYALFAWSIRPNHVHVVVQPVPPWTLPGILKTWKGFTATAANRLLARTGTFWQPEYYDHIIRTESELAATVRYVTANPAKAGLKNWPWVYPPDVARVSDP